MGKPIYSAEINGSFHFEDLDPDQLDVVPNGMGRFHILLDNQSVEARVVSTDLVAKKMIIRLRGVDYTVQLSDKMDRLVKSMGLGLQQGQKISEIKAPMPGLVLEVQAESGQPVKKGDPLLILEAMKMENVIKSPGDGLVKAVHIQKGEAVEKGALLLELD